MSDILKRAAEAQKYGRRNIQKMIRQVGALREAIRAEGTQAVHGAWDLVEEHIDYAYRADIIPEMAAEIERQTARAEAAEAILADAGALRDAAGRVSEWFCTEARDHEGPRINALRMAMIAYDRHMQPGPHAAMKEGR